MRLQHISYKAISYTFNLFFLRDFNKMNKSVIVVLLAVMVASVMVQTGDAFLRNGRDSIPAKRENTLADEFFNEYLRERFPVDDRFKKSELICNLICYAEQ